MSDPVGVKVRGPLCLPLFVGLRATIVGRHAAGGGVDISFRNLFAHALAVTVNQAVPVATLTGVPALFRVRGGRNETGDTTSTHVTPKGGR